MNILRVIPSMNPEIGGPCQGIRNSVPSLNNLGIYNEVICMDSPDDTYIGSDSFPINAIGNSGGPWGYSANLIPWLIENFERFDVVIVHGIWQYHSYATLKALILYKKRNSEKSVPKMYVMPHGMLDPWFQRAPGRKFKAIRNWFYWKLIESEVINNSDGVLFTCQEELKLARIPFGPYKPRRELNISYGVASPPPYNESMSIDFKKACKGLQRPYFLFLSRIDIKKGIENLIHSYKLLKNKYPVLPDLVIAGPGLETPYGKRLQVIADSDENIIFPGMLKGGAKWGAFYDCEAFILPSHQENFGIAVVEALACKKAVLISNQVNIWNEIDNGRAGIVDTDTLEGVYRMLDSWLQLSTIEKTTLNHNAYEVYQNKFTTQQAALNMLKVLTETHNGPN